MAYLFEINEKLVVPTPETLLISPFKEIWERDESKKKIQALKEFAYIEFISSVKKSNPYREYPEEEKENVLKTEIIKSKSWKPDSLIFEAIEKIKQFQEEASTTYGYYMAAKSLAEKMKVFFNTVEVTERNYKTGNPIYKPRDITSALNDTEKVLANLKGLEKKVEEEIYEVIKRKSDKEISPFANPNSLK